MKVLMTWLSGCFSMAIFLQGISGNALWGQQWTPPTPEELAMTSIPQVAGAPAVILYREEKTEDDTGTSSYYFRLKVLSDRGKHYADFELPYYAGGTVVDAIEGRTIHPDGTIIPFTGKPYDKLVVKENGLQVKEKVFTMPSVDVGSILETRFRVHLDESVSAPQWIVQGELYTRKAHFMWRPTNKLVLVGGKQLAHRVRWTPILPAGTEVKHSLFGGDQGEFDLDVHDVPPLPVEDDMPPMQSLSYRVQFYYTPYDSAAEYWANAGRDWSKERDSFIGPSSAVKDYVRTVVSDGDTDDVKARKLYAVVMTFDNESFSRERTAAEFEAPSFRDLRTEDVLKRKWGSRYQLTELFVAMARAAGLKAYVMGVANRDERIWNANYTSLNQMDDWIAIVEIGGKDVYFDPGERYCEAEHLTWKHTLAGGLRQTDKGVALASTPGESYKTSKVVRIADLKLDDKGEASGSVSLSFTGDPAVVWRQKALTADEAKLRADLVDGLQKMLPSGVEVKLVQITNIADIDKPLKASFEIHGVIGSATGKRLLMPADLFEVNAKPLFPAAKRENPVDLHYARQVQDATRFTLPDGMTVESAPDDDQQAFTNEALFEVKATKAAGSITSYRTVMLAVPMFHAEDYDGLRGFYNKLDAKDQETIVLTRVPTGGDATKKPGS